MVVITCAVTLSLFDASVTTWTLSLLTKMGTPEMGRYLRQIVDNSFEEGQFESAVAMLDQLRAPVHRPSIIHILHLVFIALHPVHDSQLNDEDRYDPATLLAQSPRKMIKQTKASIILSSAAVLAARRLLLAFLATNGAHAIGPALPFYPETKNEVPMEFEFGESPIFEQAAAIKTSTRSVWEILKSGYTSRAAQHFGLGSPKGKRRESTRVRFTAEPSFSDVRQDIQVVGDDSWFVLEWLVTLFEKDAEETEAQGQPRYSPLLLKQLPPPPMGSTTRWDASEPAKIVFYAFQQPDLRIQKVGLRLLLLLIDLTQTSLLNLPALASTVLAQMTSSSSSSSSSSNSPSPRTRSRKTHTPSPSPAPSTALAFASSFDTLFAHLPSSPAALSFKLALCRKIIEDAASLASTETDEDAGRAGGWSGNGNGNRPRGAAGTGQSAMKRPRAVPRPVTRQRTMKESTDASNSGAGVPSSPTMSKTASSSSSIAPPPPLSASSTLASIAPSTSTSTTATSASLPVRPKTFVARLPSWTDVVRLARVSVDVAPGPGGAGEQPSANGNTHTNANANGKKRAGRTNAHARNPNLTNLTITNPSRPWTAPSVLARVKFEMMLAYAVVQVMRREVSSTSPPSGAPTSNGAPDPSPTLDDPPDPAFLQSHTDGSYAALLDDVFALQGSNEDEERLGYVLVLRAVVGMEVGVE
ncbi:unnamed protein product [Cyclocybe aegerita]|uniref:Uncharacterized protein n=1 Tax=Cyclocybe aegerita TaxID=1973307 RepID=A0A8S0W8Y4_CYCAE|nr:unnamed protein product [Cyclocybe aegerita]